MGGGVFSVFVRDRGEPTELSNEDLQTKKAKAREDPADLPVTRRLVSFLSRISGQSTEETSVLQEAAKPLHLGKISFHIAFTLLSLRLLSVD